MPLRLSDLLDRIRPAGAPGAPAEGESRRQQALAEELGAITDELLAIDGAADEIVAQARRRAAEIATDGDRHARQLRAELPDRVAVARSSNVGREEHEIDDQLAQLAEQTQRAITARRQALESRSDALVAEAVDLIWRIGAPGGEDGA